jgi:hypothetical protein
MDGRREEEGERKRGGVCTSSRSASDMVALGFYLGWSVLFGLEGQQLHLPS